MISDLTRRIDSCVKDKTILITGGAGTIGRALADRLVQYGPKALRLLDVSEEKAFYLEMAFRQKNSVRILLGDIRDRNRMVRALQGVDIVLHTAALKHVELGEYNPFEVVSTNLTALQSLIEISLDANVERFVFTSSDKAVNPTNVMGGSKFIGERLITAANGYRGPKRTVFSCTRFGNVLGSSGSVMPVFERQIVRGGPITITEPEMTRFFMTLDEAVDLVLTAMTISRGGEIFVPKMHAIRLIDLAGAMIELRSPQKKIEMQRIGLRPGEKWYEELITDHEQARCLETKELLIVMPYLKGLSVASGGEAHESGPSDYPDGARWTDRAFSSKSATPLSHEAVLRLLQQQMKAAEALS